jgi:presenilin-like A22 family membrane protease
VKPGSIKLFDVLFPLAALLVLVSAVLSFGNLEERALIDFGGEGGGARGMAIWMVIASLFIFALLASISLLRMGMVRYLLALVVLYALFQNYLAFAALGPHLAGFVDLAASLVAGAAVIVLFRADARQWFAEDPRDRVAP